MYGPRIDLFLLSAVMVCVQNIIHRVRHGVIYNEATVYVCLLFSVLESS